MLSTTLTTMLQDHLTKDDTILTTRTLITHGLSCLQQERYSEGILCFALARERLRTDQGHLHVVLDMLIQATNTILETRQVLHEASKRFAESIHAQQEQVETLQKLLPMLEDATLSTAVLPYEKRSSTQSGLRLLSVETQPEHPLPASPASLLPALSFTCFGHFTVLRAGTEHVELCRNLKGQAILRYLVAQPEHRATIDQLMEALWAEEPAERARHKLQVAISALRRSLNTGIVQEAGGGYILYNRQCYQLNPAVGLFSDSNEFLAWHQQGKRCHDERERMTYYERACTLYKGPFLQEDLYMDWSFMQREELSRTYLVMCDELTSFYLTKGLYAQAAHWASEILKINRCDEEAYRQLIRTSLALGRRGDALRQYQQCQRILWEELGVAPMPETTLLIQHLLSGVDA